MIGDSARIVLDTNQVVGAGLRWLDGAAAGNSNQCACRRENPRRRVETGARTGGAFEWPAGTRDEAPDKLCEPELEKAQGSELIAELDKSREPRGIEMEM